MKSLIDDLPAEIARQIHPNWRKNEAEYWAERDSLLQKYRDQWIAFADGAVIASGKSPVEVFHAAQQSGRHPFVICVGREDEPCRMRRIAFPYDNNYPGEALPVIQVEFRKTAHTQGITFDRVIPDTGADATALPWSDCRALQLDLGAGFPGLIGGIAGGSATTVTFQIWACLDGQSFPCRLQADFIGGERILGRDVLNRLDILFRGPATEAVINP